MAFPWKRTLVCIVAILTPFFFPWPLAAFFSFFIALFVPWIAIPVGILFDALYYSGYGFPYFTIAGFIAAGIALFVHQFVKTRIMS